MALFFFSAAVRMLLTYLLITAISLPIRIFSTVLAKDMTETFHSPPKRLVHTLQPVPLKRFHRPSSHIVWRGVCAHIFWNKNIGLPLLFRITMSNCSSAVVSVEPNIGTYTCSMGVIWAGLTDREMDDVLEYTLRDEDVAWLQVFNKERKREAGHNSKHRPMTEDQLEFLMDRFEKSSQHHVCHRCWVPPFSFSLLLSSSFLPFFFFSKRV